MKRRFVLILLTVALLIAPLTAHADMGPKPSLDITFTGLEGETYYVALLAEAPKDDFSTPLLRDNLDDAWDVGIDEATLVKFAQYESADGLFVLDGVENCTEKQHFSAGRFPPGSFKVLFYFPTTDHFVEGDKLYDAYAFNSSYTVHAEKIGLSAESSGVMTIPLVNSYRYVAVILSFLVRVFLTLSVELGIAWLFRLREKRLFRYIALVNLITQFVLTGILAVLDYQSGLLYVILAYFVLELIVCLVEAILYAIRFHKISESKIRGWKPWIYSIVANTASFFLGLFLATFASLIPMSF